MWEMDDLLKQAQGEQARFKAMQEEAEKALHEIALRHYPRLGTLDSAGIRNYADALSRAASNFVDRIEEVAGSTT
jgi:hypothetical protein